MTDGLVLLAAWAEFGVVIAVFLWFVLRRGNKDPSAEAHQSTPDHDQSGASANQL